MSVHQFLPANNFFFDHASYVWQDKVFSEEELNHIEQIGDSLPLQESTVVENDYTQMTVIENARKCKAAWMAKLQDTEFVYDRLARFSEYANERYYGFNLFGFVEDFQYTVYNSAGDHCDWHMDLPRKNVVPYRKLTLVLQLSDPSNYEGGNLELFTAPTPTTLEKKRGMVYVFPSYLLHRVTPVTKGIRKTLVAWVNGEKFR